MQKVSDQRPTAPKDGSTSSRPQLSFRNYDVNDGLQSNEFNAGAYHRGRNGALFFGGVNGLTGFYPDNIRDNRHIPPVVLTDIQLFNRSVDVGDVYDGYTILTHTFYQMTGRF